MRKILSITITLFSVNLFAQTEDTAFVGQCYFSNDGQFAFVSELKYVDLGNLKDCPVFGLYSLGKTLHNYRDYWGNRVAIVGDSLYFFNDSIYPHNVDSTLSAKDFFKTYHLTDTAINVTHLLTIEVSEKFIKEVNTFDLLQMRRKNCIAPNTKLFDYFITFNYGNTIILNDTLFSSYANKDGLIGELNEKKKTSLYEDNVFICTLGYGTRLYCNKQRTLFFIRANYASESVEVNCYDDDVPQINLNTGKEEKIAVHSTFIQRENIELRILIKVPKD